MLLVYFVIAAVPIGYLVGGSLNNIRFARLKFAILPCFAFMLEASFGVIGKITDAPPSVWLGKIVCLEYLLLTIFIWANHSMKGMDMLGAATIVNFAVISANGFRMPVTPLIYNYPELAHLVERVQNGALPEYVLVDWDGPLWFLGDTLPLGTGLASIGDLMMAIAVLMIIVDMMKAESPQIRKKRRLEERYERIAAEEAYLDERCRGCKYAAEHYGKKMDELYYAESCELNKPHKKTRWS